MNKVLHYASMTGTFMFLYGLIYLLLRFTAGYLPVIRNTKVYGIPLELPLFGGIAIFFILRYVEISSPYVNK